MGKRLSTFLLSATWLLLASRVLAAPAPAEPAPAPRDGDEVENIVVTGQRPERVRELMLEFIVEIGDPAASDRGFARWENRLCVGVYNLPNAEIAQYIADKITLIALNVGLQTGSPGCRPNLHIVFSPDARELANQMVEFAPLMFRPFGDTSATIQGPEALDEFRNSDAPVRWWQITMVVDELGLPAITLPGMNDVDPQTGAYTVPQVRGEVSRIHSGVSDALWGSLIIVDASKLDNVRWPQLTDYLAMISLAQVTPGVLPSGYDSILNLFNTGSPPDGLTALDLVYLKALYTIDTNIMPHTQRGSFANRMVYELGRIGEDE